MWTRSKTTALAVFALIVSSIAVAHTDGIYNPTANSVGDTQGIDSNAATGAAFVGPGNVAGSQAKFWWGLRAYSTAKAGTKAINLCDHLGANCTDVLTSVSTGALLPPTLIGADDCTSITTCVIQTWYDQSGSVLCTGAVACDVKQTTNANRASFTWNSGKPFAVFSGSPVVYASVATLIANIAQPFTTSAVANETVGGDYNLVSDGPQNTVIGFGTTVAQCYAGNTFATQTNTIGAYSSVQYFLNGVSSSTEVNSSFGTITNAGSSAFGLGTIQLGAQNGGTRFFIGQFREGGIWDGSPSDMTTNQRTFWAF